MSNKIIPEGYRLAAIPVPIFNWLLHKTDHFSRYCSVNEQVQDILNNQFSGKSIPPGWIEWYVRYCEPWDMPVKKILVSEHQFNTLRRCQEYISDNYDSCVQISDIIAFYVFLNLRSELHLYAKGSHHFGVVYPKCDDVIEVRLGTGGRSTYMVETNEA